MSEPIRYVDALKAENERIRKLFEATERLMLLDGEYEAAKAGTYNRLNDELQCLKAAFTWRPIETAPKDGTEILLAFRTWKEEPLGRGLGYFDAITEHWRLQDGSRLEGYLTPTHWMHLPNPPAQ